MKDNVNKALPGVPTAKAPKAPKLPTMAPTSKKSVVKQLEQVNTPQMSELAMRQAKSQEAMMTNLMAVNKAEPSIPGEKHYHIMQNGQRITTDPIPHSHIDGKMGGVKKLESAGYTLVPVAKEKLIKSPNGQWSLESC